MAMKKIKKAKEEKLNGETAVKEIVKAVDEVAENDKPFLKEETNGDLVILGDPKKVEPIVNDTEYELTLVLPKAEFKTEDFEEIVFENDEYFNVPIKATQEPVTNLNRTYLVSVAMDLLITLFDKDEDGLFELPNQEDLTRKSYYLYRTPVLLEAMIYFVGIFLGIDKEYIPYINDIQALSVAISLIKNNPTMFNEAYFKVK